MPEALFVKFRADAASKLRLGAGVLGLTGVGLLGIGLFGRPFESGIVRLLAIAAGGFGLVAVSSLLTLATRWASGRPALLITSTGLRIGTTSSTKLVDLGWGDVGTIRYASFWSGFQSAGAVMIRLRDRQKAHRTLGRFRALTGWRLVIPSGILDRSWVEIEAAIDEHRPRKYTSEELLELNRLAQAIRERLERERTHDGELRSLEDYRRVFAQGPVGVWTTPGEGMAAPMDTTVALCPEGTGWLDVAFMRGTEIEWRPKALGVIEARRSEEDADWYTFRFEFSEEEGRIRLAFETVPDECEDALEIPYVEGEEDEDEWTGDLVFERREYAGPCRPKR